MGEDVRGGVGRVDVGDEFLGGGTEGGVLGSHGSGEEGLGGRGLMNWEMMVLWRGKVCGLCWVGQ